MDYDVEREKRKSEEIRIAFREIFPLAAENDLPWAACQIKGFLRKRIEEEVAEGIFHFRACVVRILCEVSPPKSYVEDMARIVVEKAKKYDEASRVGGPLDRLKDTQKENKEMLEHFRQIMKLTGCNHTNDPDGREKLVQCLEETLAEKAAT